MDLIKANGQYCELGLTGMCGIIHTNHNAASKQHYKYYNVLHHYTTYSNLVTSVQNDGITILIVRHFRTYRSTVTINKHPIIESKCNVQLNQSTLIMHITELSIER